MIDPQKLKSQKPADLVSRKRKNPTSPIRRGFDYQDFWGLKLCCDWLITPDKYQWLWIETSPSDEIYGGFFLDDIIALGKENRYHLYQIKHKQNPETDKWTWNDLLKQEKGKRKDFKDSLIQKWFNSYFKPDLEGKISYAAFITNGYPEKHIEKFIRNEKIEIQKIVDEDPDLYERIKSQLGAEDEINVFFSNFRFSFGKKGSPEFEEQIRKCLYEELRATESGVNKLLWQIHSEAGRQHTRPLILDQLKQWCEFDNPRHLNEQFEIPTDFEFFDGIKHKKIFQDLLNPLGGIKVIHGKPGTGKSTYLSKLNDLLREYGVISVRHHYHISPKDPNPVIRLRTQRVNEAIRAQFKEYSEELGELYNKNSLNIQLFEYISRLARFAKTKGRAFVFIIDGLDYVLRQGYEEELKDFLSNVCFPQEGLWLVLGMQEIAKKYLPQVIYDNAHEDEWIEIKGLNSGAVDRIFNTNTIGLNLPDHTDSLSKLSELLYEVSKGNPLHLRYSLKQLKNQLNDSVLTDYAFRFLLPYGDEIINYYDSLWRKIPEASKTIAIIISCVEFQFTKVQLLNLISTFIDDPAKISESFRTISHLLLEKNQKLSVYHNSFRSFLQEQNEFKEQELSVKRRIKEWLEESDYEDLKWAELKKLTFFLGDPGPILQIDRDWLVDAIFSLRETHLITSQLSLAKEAGFKNGRYGKVLELSLLDVYFENARSFDEGAWKKIWELAFDANDCNYLDFNFPDLSAEQIPIIAKKAVNHGDLSIYPEAIDRLNYLHRYTSITPKGEIGGVLPISPASTIKTIAINRDHEHQRIFRYVKQFRESGWSENLFSLYVGILLDTKQFEKLSEFLKSDFQDIEFHSLLRKCAEFDNVSRENQYFELILSQRQESLNFFCLLYLLLRNQPISNLPPLPQYKVFPKKVPEYESGMREERAKIFSENFILGLLYGLTEEEEEIRKWIAQADDRWALNIMLQLFLAAIEISNNIRNGQPISAKTILGLLDTITPLEWPENRDLYELQICFHNSLSSILELVLNIKSFRKDPADLDEDDVNSILACKYYNRHRFLDLLLHYKKPLLTQSAYERFISQEQRIWLRNIVGFPERSEKYANLARLAQIHKDTGKRNEFLRLAADNLLGYGYHKDLLLDRVLESIEACHIAGSKNGVEWLKRLAPIVKNVTEYTDGDETNYIPKHFAEILAAIDPNELYKYYYQNSEDENLILAEDIFAYLIRSLKFEHDVDIGLATTALDQESFETLVSISSETVKAKEALEINKDYFGDLEYKKDIDRFDEPHIKKGEDDYSSIQPEKLKEHLASFETQYDRNQYLSKWLRYWLSARNYKIDVIYETCLYIITEDGLDRTEGEILDLLFPLAFQFDHEKAFELLCWAQANDYGWERYFTEKGKAAKRWNFVVANYKEKHMEFFEKSIIYSGTRFGGGGNYFMPIPRGIEFFALFENLALMEEVTESAVSIVESLIANLQLPKPKWVAISQVDQFDVLIQRLTWPSPLVRERAACAIARLFNYSNDKEKYFKRYLDWLRAQKLESLVAVALLPTVKALERKAGLYTYLDIKELSDAIPLTSVVIEQLVDEITYLLGQDIQIEANRKLTLPPPGEFNPSKFFAKHIRGFLPPIYIERSDKITSDTGFDFFKYWAYNSQEMAKEIDVPEQVGDAMNFMGFNPPRMTGMSTALSEVYRSAFIRTLQYAFEKKLIGVDIYHKYAFATLPVELSFWKIDTNRAPNWWPKLQYETGKDSSRDEIVKFALPNEEIESIVNRHDKSTILGINGTIEPKNGWAEGVFDTSIHLAGFAYQITGTNIPDAETIAQEILYGTFIFTVARMASRPFNILECSDKYMPSQNEPNSIDDIAIYPLLAPVRDFAINLWQWFRGYHPFMLLFKPTSEQNLLRLENKRICYFSEDRLIAWSQDWTEGIKEKTDLEIPHGTYIEVDTEYLNEFLNKIGFRLGYVMRISHKFRKYITDQEQSIEDYKLIGVSKIII